MTVAFDPGESRDFFFFLRIIELAKTVTGSCGISSTCLKFYPLPLYGDKFCPGCFSGQEPNNMEKTTGQGSAKAAFEVEIGESCMKQNSICIFFLGSLGLSNPPMKRE